MDVETVVSEVDAPPSLATDAAFAMHHSQPTDPHGQVHHGNSLLQSSRDPVKDMGAEQLVSCDESLVLKQNEL